MTRYEYHIRPKEVLSHIGYSLVLLFVFMLLFSVHNDIASRFGSSLGVLPGMSPQLSVQLFAWSLVILSFAGIGMFGIAGIYLMTSLRDSKPSLILTQDGFIDRTSMTSLGHIAWDDVDEMWLNEHRGVSELYLRFADPDSIFERYGRRKRGWLKLNQRLVKCDGTIPLNRLDEDPEVLVEVIEGCSGKDVRARPEPGR